MSSPTPPRPPEALQHSTSAQQRWQLNLGPEPEEPDFRPPGDSLGLWTIDEAAQQPPPLEGETTNPSNTPLQTPVEVPQPQESPWRDSAVTPAPPESDAETTAINMAAITSPPPAPDVDDAESTAIRVRGAEAQASADDDPEATAIRGAVGGDSTNLNNDADTAERVYPELMALEIDPVHLSIDPDTTQLNIAGDEDAMDGYVFQARPLPQPSGTWDPLAAPELKSSADTWAPKSGQDRFQAPPEPPPPPRPPSRRRVAILVLAIVLFAIAAGVAIAAYRDRIFNDPNTKLPVATGAPSSATGSTGGEVVQNYLQALADGDIVKALSLGPVGPGSRALINPDAYPSVWRAGKITDIEVSKTDPTATEIPVTYTLNGEQVSSVIKVERGEDGSFTLVRSTVTVQISGNGEGVAKVPLLIDTRPLNWNRSYEMVPGVYQASTGLPFLAFTSDATRIIKDLEQVDEWTLAPQITDKGQQAYFEAARASLSTCYQRKELSPPNCPLPEVAPQPVRGDTIKRTPDGDPLNDQKITLLATDLRLGQVQVVLSYTLSMTYTSGATSGDNRIEHLVVLTMNLAVANADLLKPEWKVP